MFPDYVDESKLVRTKTPGEWHYPPTGERFLTGKSYRPGTAEEAPPETHVPADQETVLTAIHGRTDDELRADAKERDLTIEDDWTREQIMDALLANAGYQFDHAGQACI